MDHMRRWWHYAHKRYVANALSTWQDHLCPIFKALLLCLFVQVPVLMLEAVEEDDDVFGQCVPRERA